MFHKLDTQKKGYLVAEDLKNGMPEVLQNFFTVLNYKEKDFKPDWDKVFRCIDTSESGKV